MDISHQASKVNPTLRTCGTCTLCCKLLRIESLRKPQGKWCESCAVGNGCGIYEARPTECRYFFCGYLTLHELDESWRPSVSKLVVCLEDGESKTIYVHVDPDRSDAWKRAPYYQKLKEWSRRAVAGRGQVIVKLGLRAIVIFPHKDVDLGPVGDDEMVVTQEIRTAEGIELHAMKIRRDDDRATLVIPRERRPGIALKR
jgi:hypothetical protein